MPSKSEKQKRFMNIAAHDKEFADRNKIPQDTAKHFVEEDKKVAEKKPDKKKPA